MKTITALLLPLFFAGCLATTDISHYSGNVRTDDGERPIGQIDVSNVGYQLFGCIPLFSGQVWQEGPYAERPDWNVAFFHQYATIDENLKGFKKALGEFDSKRVTNLTTFEDSWAFWSLFVIHRNVVRTTCTVLERK